MEEIIKKLQEIGFDDKEAGVYLALLELGKGTVTDIAKKASIKRTTAYQYLLKLESEGLSGRTVEKKRVLHIPEKPEKILRKLESRKKKCESLLPQLQTLFSQSGGAPKIKYYENKEGLRTIYREMTGTSKTLYSFFSAEKYYKIFSERDGMEFFENIKNQGGLLKDLVENTPAGKKYVKSDYARNFGNSKLLPKEFSLAVDVMIVGNKVAMISFVHLVGIVIENKEIADFQRNIFKLVWKNAK